MIEHHYDMFVLKASMQIHTTATDKKNSMSEAIDAFCQDGPGGPEMKKILLTIWKGFAADGESAEPLAAEFAKASGAAPALRAIVRCNMHAEQRSMEESLKSNPKILRILDLLVLRFSEGRSDGSAKGSLARALKNSDKLRASFAEKAQAQLREVLKALEHSEQAWQGPMKARASKRAVSSAPQRFDSILEALRTIILNYRAVVHFLVELSASPDDESDQWANALLDLLLDDETEALLPATAEFLQIGKKFVHYSEGHLSQNNLITAARDDIQVKEELKQMFYPDEGRVPLCISSNYTRGYYGILQQQLRSMADANTGEIIIMTGGGKAPPYHRRAKTHARVALEAASAMKQLQVVSELFVLGNEADHALGMSMHPFDVLSWMKEHKDEDQEKTLKLFAEVAGVDAKELHKDMTSVRHFVLIELNRGNGVLESWKNAAKAFKNRVKALPVALTCLIAIWRGTGALESWFHTGRVASQKFSISEASLRSRMRIRCNGPAVQEFCEKTTVAGKPQYSPGPLCLLAQNLYASAYGTGR